MTATIEVHHLTKVYRIPEGPPTLGAVLARRARGGHQQVREIRALDDVSFKVERGEIVGIVGPNGAGKSTLLKILSRITEPTAGRAVLRGRVTSLLEIGTGFHPDLSGRENVFLNGTLVGMRRKEIRRRLDEIVDFAGVGDFIDVPIKRYSSGMQMRLAFAVAAHLDPDILISDEVLAVGDIEYQKRCFGRIGWVAREGCTVLVVLHDLRAIRQMCQRTIRLAGGRVIEDGPPDRVCAAYEEGAIRSVHGAATTFDRADPPAGFHVRRVQVRDAAGEARSIIRYGEPVVFDVEVGGDCPADHYSLEFLLYKSPGATRVTNGSSGAYHGIFFPRAQQRVRVRVGPLHLTDGTYTVTFTLFAGWERCDTWEDACWFHLTGCAPFPTGRSVDPVSVVAVPHTFRALEGQANP